MNATVLERDNRRLRQMNAKLISLVAEKLNLTEEEAASHAGVTLDEATDRNEPVVARESSPAMQQELSNQLRSMRQELQLAVDGRNAAVGRAEDAEEQVKVWKGKAESSEESRSDATAEILSLQAKVSSLESQVSNLKSELEQTNGLLEESQASLKDCNAAKAQLREELDAAKQQDAE